MAGWEIIFQFLEKCGFLSGETPMKFISGICYRYYDNSLVYLLSIGNRREMGPIFFKYGIK
jgi:hypothetical protein